MKLNRACYLFFLNWLCLVALAPAQTEKVTLILQGGEEIPCGIKRIAHGYVYFTAASTSLAFKYGDFIEIEKIAAVRLGDERTLTMNEFLASRGISQPTEQPAASKPRQTPQAESSPPARVLEPPRGAGVRLARELLDSPQIKNPIGLRLPDLPPPSPTEMNYVELANLLAEAGLVGRLMNEINDGVLATRVLTKNQKQLLESLTQSAVWISRKNALREAQRVAEGEFNKLTQGQPDLLAREFRFKPASSKRAFLEFVQFLKAQNALHFQDQWQQIETVFGEEAATALRDILNNYDDWHFLFGEALEKR